MKKENFSWILTEVNYLTPVWDTNWYAHNCSAVEIYCNNFHYIHTVFHLRGSFYTDVEKILPLAILLS